MLDQDLMKRAVALALQAEAEGNLPIGAVIALDGKIIAEGANAMLVPGYDPRAHAEMNALDRVPADLWRRAREMTCYTTLEPCCMCFGRLLLSGVGRIVFGAADTEGGAGCLFDHLPRYYHEGNVPLWQGPLMPELCDDLFRRALARYMAVEQDR